MEPILQVKTEKETKNEGLFLIEPLEAGFGHTLGNSLRRVLLTSLPGNAITFVKISGVRHQFSTLPGLKEDVAEFILNLKKIRIKTTNLETFKLTLEALGPGEIKAGQIEAPAGVEIANPDLVLGHLSDKKSKISCEMTVERGFGYSPFEERKSDTLGVIPVDALYSPVTLVNYKVETTRVGRLTNYDRLVLEVTTDGTIAPMEAVKEASKILVDHFQAIVSPIIKIEEEVTGISLPQQLTRLTVEELNLPTRIANALEKSGYKTVADILGIDREKLAKVKNLGEKSLKIIDAALVEKGVPLS